MTPQKQIEFSVKSNDYFGALATFMSDLLQDGVENGWQDEYNQLLRDKVNELMWLSEKF